MTLRTLMRVRDGLDGYALSAQVPFDNYVLTCERLELLSVADEAIDLFSNDNAVRPVTF